MKKSIVITCHLLFWIFTYLSIPWIFYFLYFRICLIFQYPDRHPRGKYLIEDDYRVSLIIILSGICVFYASYFSLKFFVKRSFFFFLNLACYLIYTLVFSLHADLFSLSVAVNLGPILYFNVFGFFFKAGMEWYENRKLKLELEKDRTTS